MGKFRLSVEAENDIKAIHRYGVEKFGVRQADRYFHALFDRFQRAADTPFLYPSVDHIRPGLRRTVVGASSIYYRLGNDGGIEIMAVIGRQEFDR